MKDTFGYSSTLDELVLDVSLTSSSSLDELLIHERVPISRAEVESSLDELLVHKMVSRALSSSITLTPSSLNELLVILRKS